RIRERLSRTERPGDREASPESLGASRLPAFAITSLNNRHPEDRCFSLRCYRMPAPIDNPPNLHLATWASLAAARWVLIPTQCEDFGSQGLPVVRRSIARVQASVNPGLALLGILITMVQPRRAIHVLYEETLRADYGPDVLASRIPHAADLPEAV